MELRFTPGLLLVLEGKVGRVSDFFLVFLFVFAPVTDIIIILGFRDLGLGKSGVC